MRIRQVLLATAILLGVIVITVVSMNHIDVSQDEPVVTYRVGHKVPGFETYREVKMDISGMHIILTVIGSLIGYFAILFWMLAHVKS